MSTSCIRLPTQPHHPTYLALLVTTTEPSLTPTTMRQSVQSAMATGPQWSRT